MLLVLAVTPQKLPCVIVVLELKAEYDKPQPPHHQGIVIVVVAQPPVAVTQAHTKFSVVTVVLRLLPSSCVVIAADAVAAAKVPSHLRKVVVLFGGVGTAHHTVLVITGKSAPVAILGTPVPVVFFNNPVPNQARLVPFKATTVKAVAPVASPVCVALLTNQEQRLFTALSPVLVHGAVPPQGATSMPFCCNLPVHFGTKFIFMFVLVHVAVSVIVQLPQDN